MEELLIRFIAECKEKAKSSDDKKVKETLENVAADLSKMLYRIKPSITLKITKEK